MKNLFSILFAVVVIVLVASTGCTKKYPLEAVETLATSTYSIGDTSYLEVYPPFQYGFNQPTAVYIGNDYLLYVADTKNNRVVMMNTAGGYMSECHIDTPVAIAQDLKLDLLVAGVVIKNNSALGAIFRIHLAEALHEMGSAEIDTIRIESSNPKRRFVGIAAMPDNSYLVARTGTSNTSPVDPDTRVMRFSNTDTYITPVSDLVTGTGTGITYINQLTTMTAFPSSNNFMLLQKPTGVAYCALWMVYSSTSDFEGWQPKFDPTTAAGASADIINSNFVLPTGVAIDNKTNVFIVDAEQDSVFKFNSKGALKNESFGRVKSEGRIKHPRGIAFYNKTIFLADDSTNCIFRYKLSTDF